MGSETKTPQSSTGLDFASTRTNSGGSERVDSLKGLERGSLLPLLPDEITTTLIIPRLSWRAIMNSSQLNCAWRAALRSPVVHELRAQATTSQTIVTVPPFDCFISLYDTATGTWHRRLPRIPLDGYVARTSQSGRTRFTSFSMAGWGCVTLQGKLYIVGGCGRSGRKVHVFDVAGQGQWKECASMKHARRHSACAAFDGKIYVFGGGGDTVEVYDPEQDLWSDLAPMLSLRSEHKVVIIGDMFCVHMGFIEEGDKGGRREFAQYAEIYDPRTDHWTKVANFAIGHSSREEWADIAEAAVVIGGKLHGILDDWLYVYEEPLKCSNKTSERLRWDGSGSWKAVQRISWEVFYPTNPTFPPGTYNHYARSSVAIGNYGELFAVVCGPTCTGSHRPWTGHTGRPDHRSQWTLLESKGLGAVGQTLTWQRIPEGGALSSRPDGSPAFWAAPCISSMAGPW